MAKSNNQRRCQSIGSRTRSKQPEVASIESSHSGGRGAGGGNKANKKRVQAKLKVKKNDKRKPDETESNNSSSNERGKRRCARVSESPEIGSDDHEAAGQSSKNNDKSSSTTRSNTSESATSKETDNDSKAAAVNAASTTSSKAKGSNVLHVERAVATNNNHAPIAKSTSSKVPTKTQPINDNSGTAITPHNRSLNSPLPRRNSITPSPTLHLHNNNSQPAFPNTWQTLAHKLKPLPSSSTTNGSITTNNNNNNSIINIHLLPHSCCLHSTLSHGGYSWLGSNKRCQCLLDSNHNTSDCLSEVYYGHYVNYETNDDWETERWWLMESNISSGKKSSDKEVERHLNYMSRQPHLNEKMRGILMDWMVEMSVEYGLHAETVYLSVVLTDRALASVVMDKSEEDGHDDMIVTKDKLQCVGCACTLIASKLLEVSPPTVQDFIYITDNSYNSKEILECEASICSSLKFNFNYGTPFKYIDRFLRVSAATYSGRGNMDQKKMMEHLVFYLIDLSLVEYKFVGIKPSLVTAAAVYLARATLGIREVSPPSMSTPLDSNSIIRRSSGPAAVGFWSKTLQHYTGYDKWDLESAVKMLRQLHENAENSNLKSVFVKYKAESYGKIVFKTVLNEDDLGFF